jgi:predicted phage baseplate assembly protein
LRLYLQWQEVTDVTLTTKINDAQHDKTWVLRRREEVAETVDGATVILSFTDEHALASYKAGVSPTQDERETLVLDAVYDQITPGSCVVVSRPTRADPDTTEELILQVKEAQPISKAAYGITGRATQLVLDGPWLYEGDTDLSVVRGTTVYAQGEALDLSEAPISTPEEPVDVAGGEIELDGLYDGLEAGRWLSIAGERTDIRDEYGNVIPGIEAAEVVMLAAAVPTVDKQLIGDTPHTVLRLANDLAYTYKRDTVTIYGNVVKATHGETREEVLGSGDGSVPLQRFTLKQSPLTYLAAPTAAGVESTLEVRVNDVLWHEVARLVDQARNDRVYVTETDDDARTTVIFGDGDHGARLPTGVENVRALYRTGIGKVGNVDAQRITLLATRPLGVKGVINPRPASGGADRESRDQARRNVPIGVMTLDRLVSVQDYADFCRAFAGIGKARAARLTAGRRRLVHVTLAGADDTEIDPLSDLYRNLVRALGRYGDPYLRTRVEPRELMMLAISANVRLEPDYLWEAVAPEIRAKLLTTFGFEQRELGQDALLSEAISAIQSVPGVAYTDIDLFQAIAESDASNEARLEEKLDELTQGGAAERIVVRLARWQEREIRPAQLAYLTPAVPETLILTELTA